MRGRDCRCARVDPLLATVNAPIAASDDELEYESTVENTPDGPSPLGSPLALPGRFPEGGELRVIEDDEYVAPPVAASTSACGCPSPTVGELSDDPIVVDSEEERKENEEPIPVPEPRVLGDSLVRGSPRTLKGPRPTPYFRPAVFTPKPSSKRPLAHYRRSTYSRQHRVGKIEPSLGRKDGEGAGDVSSACSDTWRAEYGPDPSDYERDRNPESVRYHPGLQSLAGGDSDAERDG
jgi:hypothetical protein